jgi:hypothetical protein
LPAVLADGVSSPDTRGADTRWLAGWISHERPCLTPEGPGGR